MSTEKPLFDAERTPEVDPADAILVVSAFLDRCAAWGREREIPARLERMAADPTPEQAAKLHAWASWVAFLEHARRELRDGTLDHWFTERDGL